MFLPHSVTFSKLQGGEKSDRVSYMRDKLIATLKIPSILSP